VSDINLALTAAGQALRAKIEVGEGTLPLEITRVVTSSSADPDILNKTALTAEEQEFTITNRVTTGARTTISTYLNNFGNPAQGIPALATGYPLAQIGFYAEDPDEGEILYRVSQFDNPNYVPAASERAWEYSPTFNFITGNASTVIINIDPASSVTKQDVWDSTDVSTEDPAALGVKTQYFIGDDSPDYTPIPPANLYTYKGSFDPTTGLDGDGESIPTAEDRSAGDYWVASAAGNYTPPGGSSPLTFDVGDWLLSDGSEYYHSLPIRVALYEGAVIAEMRVMGDPANPTGSAFQVILPITVLEAVKNPVTGESLAQTLGRLSGNVYNHLTNSDIHVTLVWKNNVQQAIADLVAFSQRTDIFVTPQQKSVWNQAIQDALAALAMAQSNAGSINDLNGRVAQIEDSLYSNITANPFFVSFGNLAGIIITYGVWNPALQRIEC
jgi:hypothetical protein